MSKLRNKLACVIIALIATALAGCSGQPATKTGGKAGDYTSVIVDGHYCIVNHSSTYPAIWCESNNPNLPGHLHKRGNFYCQDEPSETPDGKEEICYPIKKEN